MDVIVVYKGTDDPTMQAFTQYLGYGLTTVWRRLMQDYSQQRGCFPSCFVKRAVDE